MWPSEVVMKNGYKREIRTVLFFLVSNVLLLVAGCATQTDPVLQCAERGQHFVYRQGKCIEMSTLATPPKLADDPAPSASPASSPVVKQHAASGQAHKKIKKASHPVKKKSTHGNSRWNQPRKSKVKHVTHRPAKHKANKIVGKQARKRN